MLDKIKHVLFLMAFSVMVVSCINDKEKHSPVEGDVVPMRSSSLLTMVECDGYTVVDIANPWGEGIMQRYLLVPSDAELPKNLPSGVVLRTPLEKVVLFSGVHARLLCELGVDEAIKGACDTQYLYNDAVSQGLASGAIVDCGSSLNVNSEHVVQLSPDAIFVLPYENANLDKLENLGYPLLLCADYMETSPLGCAEWMRFYGRLFGVAASADSLFLAVSSEYESLSGSVKSISERPRLMCELASSSVWYVPCGESTMGRMYADAGADYIFSYNKGSGSVPLSYELVLDKACDADIWLFKYNSKQDKTYGTLQAEYGGYAYFKPFKERNIYACNTYRKRLFEETSFHPEILLKELVSIFHPEILPGYTLRYYEKMY